MVDHSTNSHEAGSRPIVEWVWFEGTDALFQGEAVCYNTDYGTATEADGRRCSKVERPTRTSTVFAGCAARNYAASSTGQFVEVNTPGSKMVPVALGVDTVIDTGLLTFCVNGMYDVGVEGGDGDDGGRFYTGKYRGRGSAIPRQTVTAILEASMTGAWSLDATGLILTVVATAGLAAGDTVVLLGGADDATDTLVPGKYTISSITNATTLVLTSSAQALGAAGTSAVTCTGYAYTGNPTALCDLLDGEESGGIEFLNIPNAGGSSQPYMVGGVSYVCGGITLAADAEIELAQAALPGDKKCAIVLGALAGNAFVVDLVTAGITVAAGALAEVNAMDAANDAAYFEFNGARWFCKDVAGGSTEA